MCLVFTAVVVPTAVASRCALLRVEGKLGVINHASSEFNERPYELVVLVAWSRRGRVTCRAVRSSFRLSVQGNGFCGHKLAHPCRPRPPQARERRKTCVVLVRTVPQTTKRGAGVVGVKNTSHGREPGGGVAPTSCRTGVTCLYC